MNLPHTDSRRTFRVKRLHRLHKQARLEIPITSLGPHNQARLELSAKSTSSMATSTASPIIPTITSSTNLGPMTTPLTFPADCTDNMWNMQTDGLGVPWTYYTQGCAVSSCCPSSKNNPTEGWGWYSSYYSPRVCPAQYKTCQAPSIITAAQGETVAWFCPR
jgi:hypothetical protein